MPNDTSLKVTLDADAAKLERELERSSRAVRRLQDDIAKQNVGLARLNEEIARESETGMRALTRSARENQAAWNQAGVALTAGGAAIAGGLALSARAAIEWESAFAGVTKTVDDSAEGYAQLSDDLRGLARELPATTTEIAGVAEAAGQLGVARDDIVGFTRTMIDLGETTNLTAEEAATSIAQLMNVMGTAPDEVDNLGSALVALGNDGASTEKQIIEMAQRIAGAGAVVGLAESDVLALANAVASMGIEVEAGGTSVSRVLTDMSKAVSQGGEDLDNFARVAGVSAETFARSFQEAPAEAFATFIDGLARIQAAGGDVFTVLEELSLSDVRVSQALLGMASSGDLLRNSLELGADAWEENTALVQEAAKRYETSAAQIQIMQNQLNDAAITLGEALLPAISAVAGSVGDLAETFASLPAPVQQSVAGLGALGAAVALSAGAFLLIFPRIVETVDAINDIRKSGPGAATALRGIGAATIALGIAAVAGEIDNLSDQLTGVALDAGTLKEELAQLAATGTATGGLGDLFNEEAGRGARKRFGEVSALTAALKDAEFQSRGFWESFTRADVGAGKIKEIDAALKDIARTDPGLAAAEFEFFREKMEELGFTTQETRRVFKEYLGDASTVVPVTQSAAAAVDEMTSAAQAGKPVTEELGVAVVETGAKIGQTAEEAEAAAQAIEELGASIASFIDPIGAYNTALEAAQEASREGWEEAAEVQNTAIDDQIKAVRRDFEARIEAERGKEQVSRTAIQRLEDQRDATVTALEDQKTSWEDYAESVEVSVEDYLTELEKMVTAQAEWQANMLTLSTRVSEATLEELRRLGPEGAPLVAALVDASDAELARLEEAFAARSKAATEAAAQQLTDAGPVLRRVAEIAGEETARGYAEELAAGTTTVAQIAREYGISLEEGVPDKVTTAVLLAGVPESRRTVKAYVEYLERTVPKSKTTTLTTNVVTRYVTQGQRTGGTVFEADGGIVTYRADGAVVTYQANGGIVTHQSAGGDVVTRHADGSVVTYRNSSDVVAYDTASSSLSRYARGDVVTYHADGDVVTYRQGGGSTVRDEDGDTLIRSIRGDRVTHLIDGDDVTYYAGGGLEHHVAQIAPAGAWRVWAEPETGGEAYIPLSPAKRPRSEAIVAEVAAMFGGAYVKGMADGGLLTGAAAAGITSNMQFTVVESGAPRQTAEQVISLMHAEAAKQGLR